MKNKLKTFLKIYLLIILLFGFNTFVKADETNEVETPTEPPKVTIHIIDTKIQDTNANEIKTETLNAGGSKTYLITSLFGYNKLSPYTGISEKDGEYYVSDKSGPNRYYFLGWFDANDNQILADGEEYQMTANDSEALKKLVTNFNNKPQSLRFEVKNELNSSKDIYVYAKWRTVGPHTITFNFYDAKPEKDPYVVKSESKKVSPGTSFTYPQTLEQIFSESNHDRPYSGLNNPSDLTETDISGRNIYTFAGWYDENGNLIDENYVLDGNYAKALRNITVNPVTNEQKPYAISFSSNTSLEEDYVINVYAHWTVYTTPVLNINYIDNVSTASGSWSNPTGSTEYVTHTMKKPEPQPHYEFQYWKFDGTDDNTEYKAGDVYTYSFEGKESGFEETLNVYAWWKPSVTVNLYKELGSTSNNNKLFSEESFDSITINTIPEKTGYNFVGWVDANGNDVTETTFYAPEISKDKVSPVVVNLFAKWERKTINLNIVKIWEDNNNEKNTRPDSITIELYANGELFDTYELNKDNWTKVITVNEYDDNGEIISYTINELSVTDYYTSIDNKNFEITNTIKPNGRVVVKYLEKGTNIEIAELEIIEDIIDRIYTTTARDVTNYTLSVTPDNYEGTITEEDTYVYYYYVKNSGDVIVYYLDNKTGESIHEETNLHGNFDEQYTTEAIDITGYNYKFSLGETTGYYKGNERIEVRYFYEKKVYGDLEINYVDTEGNPIGDQITGHEEVGIEYTSEAIEIEGYTYKFVVGDPNGTYTDGKTTVTYVYKKNIGGSEEDIIDDSEPNNNNNQLPPKTGYEGNNNSFIELLLIAISSLGMYVSIKRKSY